MQDGNNGRIGSKLRKSLGIRIGYMKKRSVFEMIQTPRTKEGLEVSGFDFEEMASLRSCHRSALRTGCLLALIHIAGDCDSSHDKHEKNRCKTCSFRA